VDVRSLADALVGAPLGAVLLRVLEHAQIDWSARQPGQIGSRPDLAHVEAAAAAVATMGSDSLVAAMLAASCDANPWSGAPDDIAGALADAELRRPIAEAVAAEHAAFLIAPLDSDCQVLLATDPPDLIVGDLGAVYECGEFPWNGVRTHTALSSIHDTSLYCAHDAPSGDLMVWRVRVRDGARIAEITSPEAWLDLVRRHPKRTNPFRFIETRSRVMPVSSHNAWDIRLRSIDRDGTATITFIDGVTREGVHGLVMPDWRSVATEYDAVHITWSQLVVGEGHVVDAGDGWLTVSRFWGSERTVFLTDVLHTPEPVAKFAPR
jgi:hypothetical protein